MEVEVEVEVEVDVASNIDSRVLLRQYCEIESADGGYSMTSIFKLINDFALTKRLIAV